MNYTDNSKTIFTPEMITEMQDTFGKMNKKLILKLYLDTRELSGELKSYLNAMAKLTDQLTLQVADEHAASDIAPYVEICKEDGTATGLSFHGIPAEHEFESFLRGLLHASEANDELDESLKKRILSLKTPLEIKVLVTLTCPMCPDLVIAAQHIAAINSGVTADIFDIKHFEKLRNQYHVMSVPCLVINGDNISFGRKNLRELLDFIEK